MSKTDFSALMAMTGAFAVRFLREGFVVRALLWPGLLCSLAIVVTAAIYVQVGTSPVIYVTEGTWTPVFEEHNFVVREHASPETLLANGQAVRGVWKDGTQTVFGHSMGGRQTLIAESLLRDYTRAPWRIEVPPLEERPAEVRRQAGLMAGIIGLLYTLYGVVMGAGSLFRDRSSGFLESELAMARPTWLPAASRMLALGCILAPALAATLLSIDALMPIDNLTLWLIHGVAAAAMGGTLGLYLVARSSLDKGFSAPLSRALMVATALLGLGYMQPEVGRILPVCSLGAFLYGTTPSATAWMGALVLAPVVAWMTTRLELL